ncbi:hypothetical protein Godav_009073 [Gossypium davidsonii]|uniref:Peptidase S8/S53 domain-containing protein n=1 Tax=Gossypium davidsonii TaxID=34287 RepID=A0A7J8SDP1_GOSDV|nr:hypothetical protein [Gossypium davidsonii]
MATDHTKLLCFWLSFSISFIFIKLAQADNYIVQMDLSAMPKAFSGWQSWYVATLASSSANLEAKTRNSIFDFFTPSPFPAIFLEQKDGDSVVDYIKSNKGCPSVLKPAIMASGDLVLAAWPPNVGVARLNEDLVFSNFNLISGTSMACPHVSGVAALLKATYPDWSLAAIRSALMSTSNTIDNTGSPIKGMGANLRPARPLAMGASHINPNKALHPGLMYDVTVEDYLNLLCALKFTAQQIKIITKSSPNNCSNPSLDLNYPSFIAYFNDKNAKSSSRTVKEFQRTMTHVGEGSSTYIATVTPIKGVKVTVEPDKLVFMAKNEKKIFKLSIERPSQTAEAVSFGHLTWEVIGGKHVVKSPIVATSYSLEHDQLILLANGICGITKVLVPFHFSDFQS